MKFSSLLNQFYGELRFDQVEGKFKSFQATADASGDVFISGAKSTRQLVHKLFKNVQTVAVFLSRVQLVLSRR